MAKTNEQLEHMMVSMGSRLTAAENEIQGVLRNMQIVINRATLRTVLDQVEDKFKLMNESLRVIEAKLAKVLLPDDTRYYLQESEISNFRRNFRQLRMMMATFDRTRKALVELAARYNLTNSQT